MIHVGDCVEVMAGMEPESIDAVCTDPPYGLEFMGKEWDRLAGDWSDDTGRGEHARLTGRPSGKRGWDGMPPRPRYHAGPSMQQFHHAWATAALRVAKPGAYLLAFGGTRTSHRLACAIEDAGWIIRDTLCWVYASGFPKSRSSLKPSWEPITLARKPGPLRELDIEGTRIGTDSTRRDAGTVAHWGNAQSRIIGGSDSGRWPANVILTDPVFDGGWDGVEGGGWQKSSVGTMKTDGVVGGYRGLPPRRAGTVMSKPDLEGTYSRFFLIAKAPTRERIVDGERSPHPTQKPEALIRHLVKLVNVGEGVILDPFLGSGTLGVVCEGLGIRWIGIERDETYAAWAERRIAASRPEWMTA